MSPKRRQPPPEEVAHDDRAPDVHLLVAIAAFVSEDLESSATSARRAFLENLYLPAVLRGEAPPALGLVHGIEEATPAHARALVAEIKPILRSTPDAVTFVLAVAASPTATREREELVGLARRLLAEPDQAQRKKLQRALDDLRSLARIAAGSAAVVLEVLGPQDGGGACSGPSFDV